MDSIRIKSFGEYIEYIEKNYGRQHIFRGQNSLAYKLIPKIGRDTYVNRCPSLDDLQDLEEQTMRNFISMSVPYTDLRGMSSWDQWTIGQHHGLPTRFLDWTENPLIAAYFATENANDLPGLTGRASSPLYSDEISGRTAHDQWNEGSG